MDSKGTDCSQKEAKSGNFSNLNSGSQMAKDQNVREDETKFDQVI